MTRLRAHALVASALACSDVALQAWVDGGGVIDRENAFDEAVAAVRGRLALS